jgi:uncharacterized protein with HEPN domain
MWILEYVQGMDQEAFEGHGMACDAVLRNLEIRGEACKRLPKPVQDLAPEVPWRMICGFRDHLAPSYCGLDDDTIREALKMLENEGLAEIVNGVGIFVRAITIKELFDLFEVRAALDLHFLLVDRCGNEVLKGMLDGIRMKIRRYQLDSARALNDVASVVRQHLEILALLKRRDAESLALLLKRHIRQAAANLVQDPGLTV